MQTDQNYEAPRRKRTNNHIYRAEKFGYLSMADHMILNKEVESRNHRRNVVFVQDLAHQWIQIYLRNKSFNRRSSHKFFDPTASPKVIPTEFGIACEDLQWNHCTLTLHRSETNGIAD